jgi:hypothetical protein
LKDNLPDEKKQPWLDGVPVFQAESTGKTGQ